MARKPDDTGGHGIVTYKSNGGEQIVTDSHDTEAVMNTKVYEIANC